MPFDGATFVKVHVRSRDPLAVIGITPISNQFVAVHKAKVVEEFAAKGKHKAKLVKIGLARWMRQPLFPRHFKSEEFRSTHPMTDQSLPPSEIVDLARTVRERIPEAAFELDVFYEDPILYVAYKHRGKWHEAALGIWNNGNMVALAGIDGNRFSSSTQPMSFRDRIRRLVRLA